LNGHVVGTEDGAKGVFVYDYPEGVVAIPGLSEANVAVANTLKALVQHAQQIYKT
jgi:hypothetical protein